MQRVKNVDYDEDELYDDDEEYGADPEESYSQEDRDNFAALIPVVRAELEEAGSRASNKEIQNALWNYYWDVGKSDAEASAAAADGEKQEKPKSKFDQAAERSARDIADDFEDAASMLLSMAWFRDVPWILPPGRQDYLVPATPISRPRLLGGSSKLAKLAEERRKKAAAASAEGSVANGALSSLDRLTKPKDFKENEAPSAVAEPRKYPVRKKREPTPPPAEESPPPPPAEPEQEKPDLRASPTAFARTLSASPNQDILPAATTLSELLGSGQSEDPFQGPSPDDTLISHLYNTGPTKPKQTANGLTKKTEALKLDSAPPQPKLRSKGLDVPKLWAEEKAKRKPSAAFVVVGHVDHGKSTLMGRLLLDVGAVSQRDIDKYQRQASELGKASFALAWVMDTSTEERERGVTFDFAQHHFSTPKADFTILDAPGHRDFVPNMIGGASMADMAVLVVDANQLDSGMKGQTREHILLAKAVGLKKVVVAVNKLDAARPAWSQQLFESVQIDIRKLLAESGFADEDIKFVPCSGLSGANVVNQPKASSPAAWVPKAHFTLLQTLERSIPPTKPTTQETIKQPLRMQIIDVFRGSVTNPLSVAGRISSGNVQNGDVVTTQPSGEKAAIKGLEVSDEPREFAVAGQICTLHLSEIEAQHLRSGDVLCSSQHPVRVARGFTALIELLDSLLPQPVDVHLGRLHAPGTISQLIETVDGRGEQLKRRPRLLKAGQRARVRISFEEGVPLAVGEKIVVRSAGVTAAYGTVE
ncbi:hypothetical protein B0A55_05702 [Friedmanniomyces simplex]|uniref:Tr-type G domain-containing protein n=1 Tax=Friedmanniomyces simplex TaxID=329884 RepID=A0A4V6WL60_9PEZI|nr:hypothetical protein B0A55_05702 [Friedmanniomyces simplex]